MTPKRKKVEDFILLYIDKLMPKTKNVDFYKKFFARLNDDEFDKWIKDLEEGKVKLAIFAPNYSKVNLSVERNIEIAKELGHDFFQKLWVEGRGDEPTYLTPIPHIVIDLPLRRASQTLEKGISVPKNYRTVDAMTGQPTGESKGAKISYPELRICGAMGLENTMVELMKFRGGDNMGRMAFTQMLSRHGRVSLKVLEQFSSGVESKKTLNTYLTACHLRSTA